RVLEHYTWPGSCKDMKQFVQRCSVCAQTKHSMKCSSGDPTPLRIPAVPWQEVMVDLVVGLPEDKGFTGICLVVDRFSKELVAFLVMTSCTALELAQGFCDHMWKRHGMPVSI